MHFLFCFFTPAHSHPSLNNIAAWNISGVARDLMSAISANIIQSLTVNFPRVPTAISNFCASCISELDLLLPGLSVFNNLIFNDLYFERCHSKAEDVFKLIAITEGHVVKEDATHNCTMATRVKETSVLFLFNLSYESKLHFLCVQNSP